VLSIPLDQACANNRNRVEKVWLMSNVSRRRFLQLGVGATAASLLTPSIARAAAIEGNHRTRSIRDVEHVIILMQENRSFDHYFGTMRGVRGFGDPHAVTLPTGRDVFHQPDGSREVLPFHPDVPDPASRSSRISTTAGTAVTERSTTGSTTNGCRRRPPPPWPT
jgi:phospholipase C